MDYSRICFVIMPFGRKDVGANEVDFDKIYAEIFAPAITAVKLPEGGTLEPHRTDQDFFTSDIKQDMFEYLEYSRFALADISGLNFNVAYELGVRHRTRQSGTAIFRQTEAPIPFDINSIKAFPYEYQPETNAQESRALITRVLTESLVQNRMDSPVRLALAAQQQSGTIDQQLKQAENAIRKQDWIEAMNLLRQAVATEPANPLPRMRLGILLKDREKWTDARAQFEAAAAAYPGYAEAFREIGIAVNKIAKQNKAPLNTRPAPGEDELRHAIELDPEDFDALASLGGILKRAERWEEAHAAYEKSTDASGGHPYPLLNALKLRAFVNKRLGPTAADNRSLMRAERMREAQTQANPPIDKPWSFFDLAEIKLYLGDADAFKHFLKEGIRQSDADWPGQTFMDSFRLLEPAAEHSPELKSAIDFAEGLLG